MQNWKYTPKGLINNAGIVHCISEGVRYHHFPPEAHALAPLCKMPPEKWRLVVAWRIGEGSTKSPLRNRGGTIKYCQALKKSQHGNHTRLMLWKPSTCYYVSQPRTRSFKSHAARLRPKPRGKRTGWSSAEVEQDRILSTYLSLCQELRSLPNSEWVFAFSEYAW